MDKFSSQQKQWSDLAFESLENYTFDSLQSPKVELTDLNNLEYKSYLAWWNDLDPFHIGNTQNENVFHFMSTSGLPDSTLEKIFSLFQDQKDGITREEFFAMLRLIGHAQNGQTINKDMIYLGAPLPKFGEEAIHAVIKSSSLNRSESTDIPSWMIADINKPNTKLLLSPVVHPTGFHHRSKSAPEYSLNKITTFKDKEDPEEDERDRINQRFNRLSMDNNTGQNLLLTQSFKPNFLIEEDKKTNPFHNKLNPFETDESNPTTPNLTHSMNMKPNSKDMLPPPLPTQFTKPPFPKYSRNKNNYNFIYT